MQHPSSQTASEHLCLWTDSYKCQTQHKHPIISNILLLGLKSWRFLDGRPFESHWIAHSGLTAFLNVSQYSKNMNQKMHISTISTYETLFAWCVLHNISDVHSMFQTQWKAFATIMAYVRPKNLALQASSSNAFICTPCICQWWNNQLMQTAM